MRRRLPAAADESVPKDVAAGPHIPTWADPAAFEAFDRGDETRTGLALSAWFRWNRARRQWLEAQDDRRAAIRLAPRRAPYW